MSVKKVVNYVKSQNKKLSNRKIGLLNIFFKDPLINEIDIDSVFERANQILPDYFLELIDIIYVGEFQYFKDRDINAMYSDSALYISNEQDNESDLIDDVIHEFAHAVENSFGGLIYADGVIKQNFVSKRIKLKSFLKYENHDIDEYDFTEIEYDEDLDVFLKDGIGYEKLNNLTQGLFLGAYSTVSLREYFARGFEEYYLGNRDYLKTICPYIYSKLTLLEENLDEEGETKYEF
jgi:hypothetical protein